MDFCAIDFETGCKRKESACAVGLARIREYKIVDTYYSLIGLPEGIKVSNEFYSIHGISNEKLNGERLFPEVWDEMKGFIRADKLVAYNAAFDKSVLVSTLGFYEIEDPIPAFFCALNLSRNKWPLLLNHKLKTVCDYLGIELNPHDALSDAVACGKIWIEGRL